MTDAMRDKYETVRIRWIPLREAHAFIARHHRHHVPPQGGIVALGIWRDERLIGCGIIGRPVARGHAPDTCEITRTCIVDGEPNAASALLGKLRRVAQALGFRRIVTYTLPEESGASLRAAGWTQDEMLVGGGSWDTPSRRCARPNYPTTRKIRWWRDTALQQELLR